LGGGALTVTNLLVLGELRRHRRIGNREIVAVAGAHAKRAVGAGERSVGTGRDVTAAAEQVVEKATRAGGDVLTGLGAAMVLPERHQDAAALALALATIALQPLDLGQGAVEVGTHLLDLVVERPALRRLSAEQGEEAAALAAQALRLLAEAVELGLLLCRRVLVALDLLGPRGIGPRPPVARGEWACEP